MQEEKILALWHMNGGFYDTIMQSLPQWAMADDSSIMDYIYSQIGL